jgi:hypothetical protein
LGNIVLCPESYFNGLEEVPGVRDLQPLRSLGLFGSLAISVGVLLSDLGLFESYAEFSPCLGTLAFPGC